MRKIFILIIASLLLVGCASKPKPESTPTATPEATVTPEVTAEIKKNLIEGYDIYEREGEYWDENGNLVHNHPLDLDNYLIDSVAMDENMNEYSACDTIDRYSEDITFYINNNGQIPTFNNAIGTYDDTIPDKVKTVCPAKYENALNLSSDN